MTLTIDAPVSISQPSSAAPVRRRRHDKAKDPAIVEAYKSQQMTAEAIAERFDMSVGNVYRTLHRNGVTLNRARGGHQPAASATAVVKVAHSVTTRPRTLTSRVPVPSGQGRWTLTIERIVTEQVIVSGRSAIDAVNKVESDPTVHSIVALAAAKK